MIGAKKAFSLGIKALAQTLEQGVAVQNIGINCSEEKTQQRKAEVYNSFVAFRTTYFLQDKQQKNKQGSKHKIQKDTCADLHKWLDIHLPLIANDPKGHRLAIAAPRGEAKSTMISLWYLLWMIVTQRKHYIVVIADTFTQAAALLDAVKQELTTNALLMHDFPKETGIGHVWNIGNILTSGNVKVQAFGAGKKMRGIRHGTYRPDLVILDDLENDESVRNPEQRDKLQSWLSKTVLNLGAADGRMDVIYIGTILQYDSVLARTLQKPLWTTKIFRAITQWPDRMDLWDQWETIVLKEGEEQAYDFWIKNSKHMEEGGVISWPEQRSLLQLMRIRAESHSAFDSEFQNDPLCGEQAPFAESIHYWSRPSEDWIYFGACDPSLGKRGAGRDPSALLIGGFCQKTMTLCVVEALIRKRHPDDIIEDIIGLHQKYRPRLWGVEAVQFQEFFAHVLVQRAAKSGIALPVKHLINNTDKMLRIESLHPYMVQKQILLQPTQYELIRQLRHFPKAAHDDGPDALEMLWRIAVSHQNKDTIIPLSVHTNKESSWR